MFVVGKYYHIHQAVLCGGFAFMIWESRKIPECLFIVQLFESVITNVIFCFFICFLEIWQINSLYWLQSSVQVF